MWLNNVKKVKYKWPNLANLKELIRGTIYKLIWTDADSKHLVTMVHVFAKNGVWQSQQNLLIRT